MWITGLQDWWPDLNVNDLERSWEHHLKRGTEEIPKHEYRVKSRVPKLGHWFKFHGNPQKVLLYGRLKCGQSLCYTILLS